MKYNLPALETIKQLGYVQPAGREWLEKVKGENQILLPKIYCDFMEYAAGCPLFATSDLWVGEMAPHLRSPQMYHDLLQEAISSPEKQHSKNYGQSLARLSQLPRELWPADYLLIGSDYVSDMGYFGIRKMDLSQDDPPVYWRNAGDDCSKWRREYKRLSGFLARILADCLSCNDYDTAKSALAKKGWRYEESFDAEKAVPAASKAVLRKQGISFFRLKKYCSLNGIKVYCCYDERKNIFYSGIIDEGEILLAAFKREEAGRVFSDQ